MDSLIEALTKYFEKMINRKTQSIACVLGTITSSGGVKLDNHKDEIKPLFLEWTFDLIIKNSKLSGTIGAGLTAGSFQVVGRLNFPMEPQVEVKEVRCTPKNQYKAGDRVLCIPVGSDVIVVGKVI